MGGIKPPFKKAVTAAQLTQFFSCIVHAIAALFFDVTPIFYNAVQVCYHIMMMYLFLPLLLGKKESKKTTSAPPNVQATPAQKAIKDE